MINAARFLERLERLGRPRVVIVGDLILDRYVTGDVGRISPEAPIPVLSAKSSELRLGGAGNVAANLRAMEAEVQIVGIVGADPLGESLRAMLEDQGVMADTLVVDASRPTIEKTRMMSGVQQMLRVDWEDARAIEGDVAQQVLASIDAALPGASAAVVSDYGKGLLTPAVLRRTIEAARARGIPVLVDPKHEDFAVYRGASLITPNRKEAERALGRRLPTLDALEDGAAELIALADLDSIVITLGSEGIYYRTADGESARIPAQARAVFDVTGAGDTVVAHLAMYLADGLTMPEAITFANHAAGIVVGRLGTNSVTRAELRARLQEDPRPDGKLAQGEDLDRRVESWRRKGKRIVFTNGCFDVLHTGHVEYLRFARSKGDVLVVGINDDDSVRRLKGAGRPVNSFDDRALVLAALEMVDAVTPFSEDTPARLVERITPDVLVKGEDWRDKGVVGREWVESHGGQVVLAPLVPGRSTSEILHKVRSVRTPEGGEA